MIRPTIPRAVLALLTGLLLLAASAATAQVSDDPALEDRVNEISNDLRCPTCQALSVADSDASFSVQIKDKVRRMLQEGQSEEAIKAYFVSRYGQWILRAPQAEGLGLVVWLLPGAAVLLGGFWVVMRVRANQRKRLAREGGAAEDEAPGEALTSWQRRQLDMDRRRYADEEEDAT